MLPQSQTNTNTSQAIRPKTFDDYIGQKKVCDNLKVFIEASRKKESPLDHVLLFGPPGLGKTTLAHIIAHERQSQIKATSGPILVKPGDLAAILTNLQPNDILFIDEVHRLNVSVEEILYTAMEDYKLDIIIGEGPSARSIRIDLPPFTLVGATTRSGLLTRPLRERFGIPLSFDFYNHDDLCTIIENQCDKSDFSIEKSAAIEIAKRSRGTPRIAGRLLRRVNDFSIVKGETYITHEVACLALKALGIDEKGLDNNDHKYLQIISEFYNGGPVGIDTIAVAMSEESDTVEDVIEPYLVQIGFVQRTPRGRVLTNLASEHLSSF